MFGLILDPILKDRLQKALLAILVLILVFIVISNRREEGSSVGVKKLLAQAEKTQQNDPREALLLYRQAAEKEPDNEQIYGRLRDLENLILHQFVLSSATNLSSTYSQTDELLRELLNGLKLDLGMYTAQDKLRESVRIASSLIPIDATTQKVKELFLEALAFQGKALEWLFDVERRIAEDSGASKSGGGQKSQPGLGKEELRVRQEEFLQDLHKADLCVADGLKMCIPLVRKLLKDDVYYFMSLELINSHIAPLGIEPGRKASLYLEDGKNKLLAGDYEEASLALLRATLIEPKDPYPYFYLGQIYSLQGPQAKSWALFYYNKALEVAPDFKEAQKAKEALI